MVLRAPPPAGVDAVPRRRCSAGVAQAHRVLLWVLGAGPNLDALAARHAVGVRRLSLRRGPMRPLRLRWRQRGGLQLQLLLLLQLHTKRDGGAWVVRGVRGGAPVLSDVVHVCELTYKAHTVTIGGYVSKRKKGNAITSTLLLCAA